MCISSSFFSFSIFLYFFFFFINNAIYIAILREIVVKRVYGKCKKYIETLMYAYSSTLTLLKFIYQYCKFSVKTEICCYNSKHMFITSISSVCLHYRSTFFSHLLQSRLFSTINFRTKILFLKLKISSI